MKTLAFVAFFLVSWALPVLAASSGDPPSYLAAEREAEAFLIPCHQSKAKAADDGLSLQDWCLENQQNFVWQYVTALAGIPYGMSPLARSFSLRARAEDGSDQSDWVGMPVNQVQACAWRVVAFVIQDLPAGAISDNNSSGPMGYPFLSGIDERNMVDDCQLLSSAELDHAKARAETLLQYITSAPLPAPAEGWRGWEPDMRSFEAGLRAP